VLECILYDSTSHVVEHKARIRIDENVPTSKKQLNLPKKL
jgi:hypothetical protein